MRMLTLDHRKLMCWLPHRRKPDRCCSGGARAMNRLGLMDGESQVWVWQCRKCGKTWEGSEDKPDGRTVFIEVSDGSPGSAAIELDSDEHIDKEA